MYLQDWEGKGWFDVVMEFEGIYITESSYLAAFSPWSDATWWEQIKTKAAAALAKPEYQGIEVLLASNSANSGSAFVLFRKDGKLYEVNGGHCSCYGLKGQWFPEETSIEALTHRLDTSDFGKEGWDRNNEFAKELREVISGFSSNT